MKTLRTLPAIALAGFVSTAVAVTPGLAARVDVYDPPVPVVLIGSDCYAIGEQVAAESGGTLAKASQSTQDGQPVCVIVVLVPGKDGQRPRRTQVVVPQG